MKTLLFATLLASISPVALAEGVPDGAFGSHGVLTVDFPSVADAQERVKDGVVDAEGRYVSVATVYDPMDPYIYSAQISRHMPSGAPDTSVDGTGATRFKLGLYGTKLLALAARGDLVVAAGTTNLSDVEELMLCRFENSADMQPDGIAQACRTYDIPVDAFDPDHRAMDVAILPDGKILVLSEPPAGDRAYRLTRFASDGSIDQTLGECGCGNAYSSGVFQHNLKPAAMTVDPISGAIVVASFETIYNTATVVTRHLEDGTIDTDFNGTGYTVVGFDAVIKNGFAPFPVSSSTDRPVDILAMPEDGSVVLLASVTPVPQQPDPQIDPSDYELAGLMKILADGTTEKNFGGGVGASMVRLGDSSRFSPGALTPLADGRLLVGGACKGCLGASASTFGVMRLEADGTIENTWGHPLDPSDGVGVLLTNEGTLSDGARLTALAPDGERVVMFGHASFGLDEEEGETRDGVIARIVPYLDNLIFSDSFED